MNNDGLMKLPNIVEERHKKINGLIELVSVLIDKSVLKNDKESLRHVHIHSLDSMSTDEQKLQSLVKSASNLMISVNKEYGHTALSDFYERCKDIENGSWVRQVITLDNFGLTPETLKRALYIKKENVEVNIGI